MAKTQLNLKLYHKGKLLDVVKQGRDFKDKWFIGSNKYMFWQILDPSFPEKFQLLSRKGEQYYLNLNRSMQFAYDGASATSGNEVALPADKTGQVSIGKDWVISYEYKEPWVRTLTEEERQIVTQYSRRSELNPFEKFSRNFLIAATVLTIIGIAVYDKVKPDYKVATSLAEYNQQMQEVATKVELPPMPTNNVAAEEPGTTEKAPVATSTKGVPGGTGKGTGNVKGSISGLFGGGGGFDPNATGKAMAFAVTTEEDIVASSLGGRGGGGGGGGGNGKGPGKGGGSGYGPGGPGGGFGTVFDPSQVSSGTANLAGLSTGRPKGMSTTSAPAGGIATYVGDASRLVPVGKVATRVSGSVIARFSGPEVKKVQEGNLSSAPAETRPELQRIEQTVARNKPQIKDLFNRYSQVKSMYGSLKFTLYIEADGSVSGVQITPLSGEFYPEFMSKLEQLIRGWRFNNKNMVPYEFIMTFSK